MPHILKNDLLEINIDLPHEGYRRPRFDWTGKITSVLYRGIPVTGKERLDAEDESIFGKGLYNEFDLETALGYEAVEAGDWFHKIGVGLLRKEKGPYVFHHPYETRAADFQVEAASDRIKLSCRSANLHGYAYVLQKEIVLEESGFSVHYELENVGEKMIRTKEYNHNFLAIGEAFMGPDYSLTFPSPIIPGHGESINPEGKLQFGRHKASFSDQPEQTFFFSNLYGGKEGQAKWSLEHQSHKIGISESLSLPTRGVNLWGEQHVISPELFAEIEVLPGNHKSWRRSYEIYLI